jgi:hypothetical protein
LAEEQGRLSRVPKTGSLVPPRCPRIQEATSLATPEQGFQSTRTDRTKYVGRTRGCYESPIPIACDDLVSPPRSKIFRSWVLYRDGVTPCHVIYYRHPPVTSGERPACDSTNITTSGLIRHREQDDSTVLARSSSPVSLLTEHPLPGHFRGKRSVSGPHATGRPQRDPCGSTSSP